MFGRKLGMATLAISSLIGLAQVASARDHDRDYDRYYNRGSYGDRYYGGMTDHQRHEIEERREEQARWARKRWERDQRRAAQNGYYNNPYDQPYNNGYYGGYGNYSYNDRYSRNNTGYYDTYGNWHPYRR